MSGSAYVEPEEPAERSYFIAESMDYTDNGCTNVDDLNDVTSSLRAALSHDGWSGTRMTEAMTVPADFIDSFSQDHGRDDMAADSMRLSVYAGHGYMNSISWGTRDPNPELSQEQGCRARFSDGVRLGRMAGGWARIVLFMTSCTGNLECYESSRGHE